MQLEFKHDVVDAKVDKRQETVDNPRQRRHVTLVSHVWYTSDVHAFANAIGNHHRWPACLGCSRCVQLPVWLLLL